MVFRAISTKGSGTDYPDLQKALESREKKFVWKMEESEAGWFWTLKFPIPKELGLIDRIKAIWSQF